MVKFRIKEYNKKWSNQELHFALECGIEVDICIQDDQCELILDGDCTEEENLEYITILWEILAWMDGYFYEPVLYSVAGCERSIEKELLSLKWRTTDSYWISSATLLCRNNRPIDANLVNQYVDIRKGNRRSKSMNLSMITSFFFLISESYRNINIEHRLALLMCICDGFGRTFLDGDDGNVGGNICKIVDLLEKKSVKNMAFILDIPKNKLMNDITLTRNELIHYSYKEDSFGTYICNPEKRTDNRSYMYLFYILSDALRVAMLKTIGVDVLPEVKNYLKSSIIGWLERTSFRKELIESLPETFKC